MLSRKRETPSRKYWVGRRAAVPWSPGLVSAVLFLSTGWGGSPAVAQTPPALKLVGTEVVEIELRADQTAGVAQFFLAQESATAAAEVALAAVLPQGTVTFSPDPQVVPPAPKQLAVTASISGLTLGGAFEGALVANTGGSATSIGRLVVRKTPKLAVQGTGHDGIKLSHPVPEFQRTFTIVSNATAAVEVTLAVDDFIDAASVASATTVTVSGQPYDGQPFTVAGGGSYGFKVSAWLSGAGEHTSRIVLKHGAERFETPLAVTRTNIQPTVTVDPLPQLETTRCPLGNLLSTAQAPLRIALRETGGRLQVLTRPQLVNLVRKDGARQLSTAGELVFDDDGDTDGPVSLTPYESAVLEPRLTGLTRAGELSGTIRFNDGTGSVIDQPLTVFVRDHFSWAFFWILLGVGVSWGLHWWLTQRSQKLRDQNELLLLEEQLRRLAQWLPSPPPRGAQRLLESFRNNIDRTYDRLSSPFESETDTHLADLKAKVVLLGRWLHAAVQAQELGARRKHDETFQSLGRRLTARGSTAAERTQLVTDLTALENALDADRALPLDELERRLDALLEAASSDADRQAVQNQLHNLKDAQTAFDSGESEKAEGLVDAIHQFLASSLLLRLRGLITGAKPAPGVEEARWTTLQGDLLPKIDAAEALTGEAKVEEADRLLGSLLRELVAGFGHRITSQANAIEEDNPDLAEGLRELEAELQPAGARLTEGAIVAAAALYQRVKYKYRFGMRQKLVENQVRMNNPQEQDLLDIPTPLEELRRRSAPKTAPPPENPRPNRRALEDRYRLERGVVTATLAVIAVVVGMNLLYIDEPGWGGWADYLVALLWGLGVHTVGNVRSAGVLGLREQFASTPGQ